MPIGLLGFSETNRLAGAGLLGCLDIVRVTPLTAYRRGGLRKTSPRIGRLQQSSFQSPVTPLAPSGIAYGLTTAFPPFHNADPLNTAGAPCAGIWIDIVELRPAPSHSPQDAH